MIRAADYAAQLAQPMTIDQKVDALVAALGFAEANGQLVKLNTRIGMKYNKPGGTTTHGTPRQKVFTHRIPITIMNEIRALQVGQAYDLTEVARNIGINLAEAARRMTHSSANIRARNHNNLRLHTYQEGNRILVLRTA